MSSDISFKMEIIDWLMRWEIQFTKKKITIVLTVDMNILWTYISYISKIFLAANKKSRLIVHLVNWKDEKRSTRRLLVWECVISFMGSVFCNIIINIF